MFALSFLLPLAIVALVFYFIFSARRRTMALLKNGIPAVGQVLEINQTGTEINGIPMMRLRVRVEQAGVPSREVTLKQLIGLGNMPRPGEQILLSLDPTDPTKAAYGGLVSGMTATAAGLNSTQTQDILAITPALRENGKLGVGTILSMIPNGASTQVIVEVDSVVDPKYNVTIDQVMSGFNYQVGDRAYLMIDKSNPSSAALMPLSFTQGKKIDKTANRLDPLVLDPQLQKAGRKAHGTVLACNQVPMNNPILEAKGMQRWHLTFHVVPDDGTPAYDADSTISFTTPEKVARICVPGAQVPIRYDANDPRTFATDTMAMGYPDPYIAVYAAYGQTPPPA